MAQPVDLLDPALRVAASLIAIVVALWVFRNPDSARGIVGNRVSQRAVQVIAGFLLLAAVVGIAATGAVYAGVIG